jgi:hypothetical protein
MDSEEIISEFRKKNKVTTIIGYTYIVVICIGFILWQIYDLPLSYVIVTFLGIIIPLNIFFFTYWVCPNCKSYLGGSENIEECPNCHFRFEKTTNSQKVHHSINYINNGKDNVRTNTYVENIATFPDYKKYNTYNLVEIYQRIDHYRNAKKIKIIENLIRERLNIDPLVSLDSSDIQKKFSTILEGDKPKTIRETENSEISKMLGWFQIALLIGVILSLALKFLDFKKDIVLNIVLVLFAVISFIEFIKGFYSDEILTIWRSTVNFKESPILFKFNQLILFAFFLLMLLVLFRSL